MTRGLFIFVAACLLAACGSGDLTQSDKPRAVKPKGQIDREPLQAAKAPRGQHDPAIVAWLSKLKYKPDPYETQTTCVSEPTSQQRDALVLWVELSLMRDTQGAVALKQADYSVTTANLAGGERVPDSADIPRLELVHHDGRVIHTNFEGIYRDPQSSEQRRTRDAIPGDPTWVLSWLASADITKDVVAHRIVLGGRVLQEVKRPDHPPGLGAINCQNASGDGLKLSWQATQKDTQVPLRAEVLRVQNGSFFELLPSADGRQVQGLTLLPAERSAAEDLVLLVALTDTFHFVTRGVLVPRPTL